MLLAVIKKTPIENGRHQLERPLLVRGAGIPRELTEWALCDSHLYAQYRDDTPQQS